MVDKTKTLAIGLFIIAACASVIWLLLFMHPSVGDMSQTLHVHFANIDRVARGTRVNFAGKPVGEVIDIVPLMHARTENTDNAGHVYYYDVVIGLDKSVTVYTTDHVVLQTSGLMGERNIAILPTPLRSGTVPVNAIRTNTPIYGDSSDPMQEAFIQLDNVTDKMNKMMETINQLIESNRDDLSRTIHALEQTVTHLDITISRANEIDLVGSVQQAATQLSHAMEHASGILAKWEEDNMGDTVANTMKNLESISSALNQPEALSQIIENVSTLSLRLSDATEHLGPTLDNFSRAAASAEVMATKGADLFNHIAAGKGTIGHLIYDDSLYLQVESSIDKVSTLMNDINHYGLLFHLNKQWQRERTRRMTLLNTLSSPSAFKEYFDTELDQMTTSLERLTLLLNKTENSSEKTQSLRRNKDVADAFGDLLRRVDTLDDTLRAYNERLFSKPTNEDQ